jgi:outer membrane protein OmpA-like peptidoglycan-associated protein
MRSIPRIALLLPAVLILVPACATKSWVRETLDKRDAQIGRQVETVDLQVSSVGERVGAVEDRVAKDSRLIEGVDARLDTLGSTATEASETARAAREVSSAATTKAEAVDQRVTRLWANRYNPKLVDTVQILFGFDRADLDDRAQTSLVNLARDLQANQNLTVELLGYTDTRGPREYNYQLSQRRVDAARRFLAERGVQLARIRSVGLGPVADSSAPDSEKRRVTAKLLLEQD